MYALQSCSPTVMHICGFQEHHHTLLSWTLTAMLKLCIKPLPAAEVDDQMSLLEAQPLANEQTSHGRSDGSVEPSLYHELSSIPQARLLAFCGPIQSCLLILDE